jgi:DNA-binding SARP family transcriptional activator/tetratricopeptide (TPR) repeat protein
MTTGTLRFAVYGGPRVWRDDVEVDLGPPQRRLLLGLLMLAGAGSVSMDLIVKTLWEDDPPETALNVVHRHVGMLRRTLEPQLTSRQPGSYVAAAGTGYCLTVSGHALDVLELRSLLLGDPDQGKVSRAVEICAERAGSGLPSSVTLDALLAPLEANRVAAGVAAAGFIKAAGDALQARRLLPTIQGIANDHPFDEPLQAALVRALVAAGRRGDALAHYGTVRALMDVELGLEPGAELKAAQHDALVDPLPRRELTVAAAADRVEVAGAVVRRPAQLPFSPGVVVGRERERAEVAERLRTRASYPICALTGMGGVGKTTLALQCAGDVVDCYPDGQLYANLHGYDDEIGPTPPTEVLRGFLVALGVPPSEVPPDSEDRSALFRSLVADASVLVVLDNAHDGAQVRSLLPGGPGCGVLVTSRRRLDELAAAGAFALQLDRLDHDAGIALLRHRAGDARVLAEPVAADRIVEACEGLPLALCIVGAQASRYREATLQELLDGLAEPSATLDSLSGDGSSATDLRRVLSWSYDGLPAPAAHLFRCTGIQPGPDLSLLAAASLAGVDLASARQSLAQLSRANLLIEVAPSRYQAHQLLRAYARELLADAEAHEARRRLVDHYVGSVRSAYLLHGRPPLWPIPAAAPGTSPESFRSRGEALAWYLRERRTVGALVLQTAAGQQALESALLVLDGRPLAQLSSPAGDLLPLTTAALDAVTRAGALDLLRAELRRDLGLLLCRAGQRDRGRVELEHALEAFETIGDATGESSTLRNLARVARFGGNHEAELDYARRSVEVAQREEDEAAEAVALTVLTETLTSAGLHEEAITAGERSVELAHAHGIDAWETHALEALAHACAAAGDFDRAILHTTQARDVEHSQGLGTGSSLTETRHHLHLAEFQYGAGDRAAALASYLRYLERADSFGPLSASIAVVDPTEAALGDPQRVRQRIAELSD